MSKTAATSAIGRTPSPSLLARFIDALDRALMTSARTAARNGDLPPFGL